MYEIVRQLRRSPSARELADRLASISAQAVERQRHIDVMTGLVPQVMERVAGLSLLKDALSQQAPSASARLDFIVDVATAAMTAVATDL